MSASKLSFSVPIAEFEEFLECPVCYTIPDSSPIYQCENGHFYTVDGCARPVMNSVCHTCKRPIGGINYVLAAGNQKVSSKFV